MSLFCIIFLGQFQTCWMEFIIQKKNPMDVVNTALQKGQEERKKKQVLNVQTGEVEAQRRKGIWH